MYEQGISNYFNNEDLKKIERKIFDLIFYIKRSFRDLHDNQSHPAHYVCPSDVLRNIEALNSSLKASFKGGRYE